MVLVMVRLGKASTVKVMGWPVWIRPMSDSLIWAVTCSPLRLVSEMKLELLELLLDEPELAPLAEVAAAPLVAPPLSHWPTAPLMVVTVPSVGATRTAASRLF